jgi:hypothetical protein
MDIHSRVNHLAGKIISKQLPISYAARGSAVVEALSYKPEVRGIDSRWC